MSLSEAPAKTRTRMSADDRRAMVVAAAVTEFAQHGYEGTATEAIAKRAGVSQPYLFQLFGSKRELFVATLREVFARTWDAFDAAVAVTRPVDSSVEGLLHAMGGAYCELLSDRDLLRCQLHAYAACADDGIRAAVRAEFSELYRRVAAASDADPETLDVWFARGMLMNTIAAIAPDLTNEGEELTLSALTPVEGKLPPPRAERGGTPAERMEAVVKAAAEAARATTAAAEPAAKKPRSRPAARK